MDLEKLREQLRSSERRENQIWGQIIRYAEQYGNDLSGELLALIVNYNNLRNERIDINTEIANSLPRTLSDSWDSENSDTH